MQKDPKSAEIPEQADPPGTAGPAAAPPSRENEQKHAVAEAAKDEIERRNVTDAVVQKMIRTLEKQDRARIAQAKAKEEERISREVHSVVRCLVSKTVAAHEPTLNNGHAAPFEHNSKKAGAKEAPNATSGSRIDEWGYSVGWSAEYKENYWWHEQTRRAEWYVNLNTCLPPSMHCLLN